MAVKIQGQMSPEELSTSGVLLEVNRALLHRAGYRMVLLTPSEEQLQEAEEQGWDTPAPSLAIIDMADEPGGVVYSDEVMGLEAEKVEMMINAFSKRIYERAEKRTERYKFDFQAPLKK